MNSLAIIAERSSQGAAFDHRRPKGLPVPRALSCAAVPRPALGCRRFFDWASRVFLLLLAFGAIAARSEAQVLIKEVISREVSIHIGGVQTPDIKTIVSREASLFIENGTPSKQVVSREVSLAVADSATPPQVTRYLVAPSPTGDSVALDWSNYNPWALKDVHHFDIYISDTPFTDVTGLTPKLTVGGETVTATIAGLTQFHDHFIAIVAVDVLGNRNTTVINSAAYIISPQVVSREVSLFVGDDRPYIGLPLLSRGSEAKILVPADGSLGSTWRQPSFTPTGWLTGNTGVGFGLQPGIAVREVGQNTALYGGMYDLATAVALLTAPANSDRIRETHFTLLPTLNLLGDGGDGHYPNNSPLLLNDRSHYAVQATGFIRIPAAGDYTFGLNSDDGGQIKIDGAAVMMDDSNHGPQDHLGTATLTAGLHSFEVIMWQGFGGDEVEFYAAPGALTSWTPAFALVGDVGSGGLEALAPLFRSGDSQSLVQTNIEQQMRNVNASVYVRQEFNVPSPASLAYLVLKMTYADGFVAYLNGTEVARRNAPAGLSFNSAATAKRTVGEAVTTETIDITAFTSLLVQGTNVLAIQGLNDAVNDGAFLILPEIFGATIPAGRPGYRELVSREVSLGVASATVPPQVTGYTVTSSATGDGAMLDWTNYNPWAVKTVAHFDIYVSDSPFTNVTGMTPVKTVGGETITTTVTGLIPLRDHYFAIVAVDVLGNRNTVVVNSAAYVLSPQVISREVSLFVGGEPVPPYREMVSREVSILVPDAAVPAPVTGPGSGFSALTSATRYRALDLAWPNYNELLQHDVVRYRVYVDTVFFTNVTGMTQHSFVPAGTQRTSAIVPLGNQIYYSAVVAEDALGNFNPVVSAVSAQSSLSEIWVPSDNSITYGGTVLQNGATIRAAGTLQADATVAAAIARVDFFVRPNAGVDVLLNSDTTPGDGFTAFWDASTFANGGYVFTIRAFDNVGRFTELTRTVTLNFNYPPVITSMKFDGADLANNATISHSGRLGAVATDNDGIGLAEFFHQAVGSPNRTSLGTDVTPANGLDVPLNLESLNDGAYDLSVRVYDTLGTFTDSTRRVNLLLAPPAAPVITSPPDGTTVQTATIQVQGTAAATGTLKIFSNGAIVFTGTPAGDGSFSASVPLVLGANAIYAVSSNRAGYGPSSDTITVTRVVVPPVLGLSLAAASVAEGGTVNGTVSIDKILTQPFTISLGVTQSGRVTFPASVVIPAGQTSATFAVQALQNQNVEGTVSVTLIASATGSNAVTSELQILDDDIPAIQFTLDRTFISENAGPGAVIGTLLLDRTLGAAITANFTATPAGQVVLPASITIPPNVQSVPVPITIVDNHVVDGNRAVAITARLLGAGGAIVANSAPANLTITDDEGPSLTLTFDRDLFIEGRNPAGTGTVTRNIVGGVTLTVNLQSANPAKLIVPATVVIPAGQPSATFPIQTVNDGVAQGNQGIVLTAAATGFNPVSATLTVTDLQKPDLTVSLIAPPTGAETDAWIDVRILLSNQGAADAQGPFTQRILLSSDDQVGDDLVLTQAEFAGRLIAGGFIEQSLRVRLPRNAGRYWLVVETDANQNVDEALEDNNATISETPLDVAAAYGATLSIVPTTVPTGTPIPITGSATLAGGGPAAFMLVNIHITNQGIERIISALTNSIGQFSTSFTPLPGQGGLFQFGASHPGSATAPVQDEVRVYGLKANPVSLEFSLAESGNQSGTITIQNLADLPVSGLTTLVTGLPAGVVFTPTFAATSIAPSGTVALNYTVSSGGPINRTPFTLSIQSTQGAALDIPMAIIVEANVPKLTTDPGQLFAGMLRGNQQLVNFTLKNDGKAPTGPVSLLLPSGVGWMRTTNALPIPAIAPGGSVPITIQLTPPADLDLGDHTGSIVATDGTFSVSIPFVFRALSDQKGQLIVHAEDEYTYYASGNPPLAGATIKVTDYLTGQVIGTVVTTASGAVDFGQLNEGYYTIEATADKHASYRATHLVEGGKVNDVRAFLSRQTVTYAWTVVPVQIEDHYKITIDTTFETVVPIPVITVEPAVIDLAEITADESVVNMKVTNHGLIAANATKLNFPTHPLWSFTPAIDQVGTLPAMSSITIPVTIRKLTAPLGSTPLAQVPGAALTAGAPAAAPAGPSSGPCFISATVCWELICGNLRNTYCATVAIANANSGCGGPAPTPSGCNNCGGGPGGGGPVYVGPGSVVKFICDPECLLLAGLGCIPGPIGCFFSGYSCGKGLGDPNTPLGLGIVDCAVGAAGCLIPGAGLPSCIYSIMRCFIQPAAAGPALANAAMAISAGAPAGAASANPITTFKPGLRAMLDVFNELTGAADGVWINALAGSSTGDWYARFQNAAAVASVGGRSVTGAERTALMADLPPGVTEAEITRFLDRWNRTVTNWTNGLLKRADAPPGESTDFIDAEILRQKLALAGQYQTLAETAGFTDPINAIVETARQREASGQGGGICARVKLRLEQDAVLTRDAFRATLELDNNGPTPLELVRVNVSIFPESGGNANSLFSVTVEGVTTLTAVDGTGALAGNSTGSARWKIIPTIDAAPLVPTRFLVGGTLSYRVDGTDVSVPLSTVPITVMPSPRLTLKYFHQRDVFSDDPFTLPIEPAIPYSLAVMVQNNGAGSARNFRITSAQPKIIENEKGLLIDFQIIATQVAGQPLQPSLTADFGDIGPGQIKIGEWLFTSSLQGLFIDYSAKFEHVDGLGNPRLSLIDSVEIHEMIHEVRALGALDDGLPDFLVNDVPEARNLPDTIYLSDGTTAPVVVVESAQASGQLIKTLTATLPAGWAYLRVPEPSNGQYELTRVVRSDGLELPLDVDAWVTDRTFIGQGRRPTYENILHLLDHDSTGSYTLTYVAKLSPDVTPPTSHVLVIPAQSAIEFPVNWSGSDDRRVAFYDISVSTDGGAFQPWLQHSQDTGAIFRGDIGHSYAFRSQATDGAGNLEAAHATADATTTVSLVNIAPTLAVIPDRQITEGDTLTVDLSANDPDGRSDLLTFAFTSSVPPGMTINSHTGQIRWVTGEADGGRTVPVTVTVTDTGVPAQSASRSLSITVLEDNKPPVLADVLPQRVTVGNTLTVQLQGSDADIPAQTLNYHFTGPIPTGMTMNGQTGLISWLPSAPQANTTVAVSVAVTDSGTPPMEAAITFPVTVDPPLVDRPPQIASIPWQLWLVGSVHTLEVNAFDPDGDAVTLALNNAGLPGGLSFASTPGTGRGLITWNTTGVTPGLYSLPVQATAGPASASVAPQVKIVKDNGYWRWALGNLNNLADPAMSDPTSDPDQDGTSNIFEWAQMRNALVKDRTPVDFTMQSYDGGWRSAELSLLRRQGSNEFVTLVPQYSNDFGSWTDVPTTDLEVFLDPFGNRDNNPDSEEVLFRIWLSPSESLEQRFFRLKSSTRAVLP